MGPASFRKSVLPSGITVLSETLPERQSVSVGVWVRSGARDEPGELLGVSHFLEHMMFKGTERRDARGIARSLESLGGHLDAFTSREQVCYTARALSEHLPEAVDVLADIVFRSRFAEAEVEREKSVVREEILSYEDTPEEKVNDVLAELLWDGHALGRPILGTEATVTTFTSEVLRGYFRGRYRPEQVVVAAAGGLDHDHLVSLVSGHFAPPDGQPRPLSGTPPPFRPAVRHEERELQQLHLALGTRGLSFVDGERYALLVLDTLLGGGMSSRLFQSVREEAGLAYSVFSALDFYRDSGMVCIQLGVSPERGREALARVREELVQLCGQGPSEDEVAAAKSQLKGSVVMAQESVSSRMAHLARQEIYHGAHTPPEEQVSRVLAVTREHVAALAARLLPPEGFALAALGPAPGGALGERDWPAPR